MSWELAWNVKKLTEEIVTKHPHVDIANADRPIWYAYGTEGNLNLAGPEDEDNDSDNDHGGAIAADREHPARPNGSAKPQKVKGATFVDGDQARRDSHKVGFDFTFMSNIMPINI